MNPPDDKGIPDIYFGLTNVRLGTTDEQGKPAEDAWESIGLDLDGLCTNSSTCRTSATTGSCHSPTQVLPYDGKLCRDNTFARLLAFIAVGPEVSTRYGLTEDAINCQLWRGAFNMLMRVHDYNGTPSDAHVRVDYYMSTGLEESASWTCPSQNFMRYPRWGTGRPWKVDDSGFEDTFTRGGRLPDSKFSDSEAYVRDGYLVAHLPAGTPQGFMGDDQVYRGFVFHATQTVLVGQLKHAQDDTWMMEDGLLAGRIAKSELVHAFNESGFCDADDSHTFYQNMVHFVDDMADVLASGSTKSDETCDAMSYALGFEAAQVSPGRAVRAPRRVTCCAPGRKLEDCLATCGDGMRTGEENCDTKIAAGAPGACPTSCPPTAECVPQTVTGSECTALCTAMPISVVGAKDGCCPASANVTTDPDCSARCGNGVIEPGETCDPPESCGVCGNGEGCFFMRETGSKEQCNMRCELRPTQDCRGGDNCCPASCDNASDSDCSSTCGNSRLDPGELCEQGSEKQCPTSCDDGDPCTKDDQTGSVQNCSLVCAHEPITQPTSGDGCCQSGTSADVDSDCKATCGNKVVEGDEQCDDGNRTAGDGCRDCKTENLQQVCLANIGADDACAQCTCANCAGGVVGCYLQEDPDAVKRCRDLVACAHDTQCSNPDCFCGRASLFSCLAGEGDGPCRAQIVAAADSASLIDINARSTDPTYPLGRANQLYPCIERSCATECAK